jgi:hypothetical protein
MITTALIVSLALAADPPPPSGETMKNLMKDVAGDKQSEGPDVSKMPFTPDSIKQVVMAYQPKIQGCYEDHIADKKKAPEGKLKTSFVITPDGLVKSAKVDKKGSTLKDPALHDCVVAVLSTMAFPKPPDSKDHPIEFPFNLKAVH